LGIPFALAFFSIFTLFSILFFFSCTGLLDEAFGLVSLFVSLFLTIGILIFSFCSKLSSNNETSK